MGQAILVFDEQGKLTEEHSRLAERIFGASAGASVVDQVYPRVEGAEMEREAFQTWVQAAVQSDPATLERLVRAADLRADSLVLDAGCGPGLVSEV